MNLMKKALAALLCAALLLTVLPTPARADSGVVDIRTAADWEQLAEHCKLDAWSRGKTVRLWNDLDLSGLAEPSIPLFMGSFEGNGHTVGGVSITGSTSVTGLFRRILEGGVVDGLRVSARVTPDGTAELVGGIAGENLGTIRNCVVSGAVKGVRRVGGIAGSNAESGLIERCTVNGSILGEHRAGGIAGENVGEISACTNRAAVNTEWMAEASSPDATLSAEEMSDITDIGGIAGYSSGAVRDSVNDGSVGYPSVGYNVGGVVGRQSGYTENCSNRGEVLGRKDVGGIVGQLDPYASWRISGGFDELRRDLDALQSGVNRLVADAKEENTEFSGDITAVLDAMDRAGDAAEALTDEGEGWINKNLDTVNDLSGRVSALLDDLVPVIEELAAFTDALPDMAGDLEKAFNALSYAADKAQPGLNRLSEALRNLQGAMTDARTAAGDIQSGIKALQSGLGDSEKVKNALSQISDGLKSLSGRTSDTIAQLLDALTDEDLDTGDDEGEGNSVESEGQKYSIPEILNALFDIVQGIELTDAQIDEIKDAIDGLLKGSADFIGQIDPDSLQSFLTALDTAFSNLGGSFSGLENASGSLRRSASSFGDAGDELARAFRLLAGAADEMERSFASLHKAADASEKAIKNLAKYEELSFTPIDRESAAQEELFDALRGVSDAVRTLSGNLNDTTLLDDLNAISDRLFALMDDLLNLFDGGDAERGYAEDISDYGERQTAGALSGCVNQGDVGAETNVGGIAGAITLELPTKPDEDLDFSSLLTGNAKYLIYALLKDCANSSAVTAKKEAAGGVAGRMDYGAVLDCASSGTVSCSGDYAGGIAGYCRGTLRHCRARVNLSAENYVGGVAGYGRDLYDCLAMPDISSADAAYRGSIAGDADGVLSGNYYAESRLGGVNGLSYEGLAQAVSYEELVALAGENDLFRTITVTFLAEAEVVATVEVPFGGRVETLPELPDKDGRYWKWDEFDNTAIYRSITVEGQYCSPLSTLSSGETPPLFLAEGSFYEGQTLSVIPYAADAAALGVSDADVLAAYTLSVDGYDGILTVHMQSDAPGKLYVLEAGAFTPVSFSQDGSYIVFELANNGSFVYVASARNRSVWPIIGAAVAVGGVAAVIVRRRKKQKVKSSDST